jgi:Carboxypeptidase regulatory-like domain
MNRHSAGRMIVIGALFGACLSPAIPAAANAIPSLTGTVTDRATGDPLAGACITAFRDADQSEQASACTGIDGTYQLQALPQDTYKVRARANGYADFWAYGGGPDFLNAQQVFVTDGNTIQFDPAMWLGAGSIQGHITDEDSQPAFGTISVERADDQSWSAIAYADANGYYRMDNIPPGPYRLALSDNVHGLQWMHGKESQDNAEIFNVTDGGLLTVDEQYLPLATVVVTVLDSKSRRPVPNPCAFVLDQLVSACGTNGTVTLTDVQPGVWSILAGDSDGAHFEGQVDGVEITRTGPNAVTVLLDPAASIVTTIRDATTLEPVSACVELLPSGARGLTGSTGGSSCSDPATGRLVVGPMDPVTTKLFVHPADDTHGAMWVTPSGNGTGDARKAAAISATTVGKPTVIPPLNIGPAGTISGYVTERSTGQPVPTVCAHPFAFDPRTGDDTSAVNCSKSDGHYIITGLGTYDWPIQFATAPLYDVAWQWSGDKPDRFAAQYVHVTAGQTSPLDAHVIRGGGAFDIQVNNSDGTPVLSASVTVFNARTGDWATWLYDTGTSSTGQVHVKGLVTQTVKIEYQVLRGVGASDCWYHDKQNFQSATEVSIRQDTPNPAITLEDCGR